MSEILPYVYVGVACLVVGAIFGVLWGRKHPKTVATVVGVAQAVDKKL